MNTLPNIWICAFLMLCSVAHADVLDCNDSPTIETLVDHVGELDKPLSNGDTRWESWYCKGELHIASFSTSASAIASYLTLAAKFFAGTLSTADVLSYQSTLPQPAYDEFLAFQHKILVKYYHAQAKTVTTRAYKRSIGGTGDAPTITYVLVGTVAIGVNCAGPLAEGDHCPIPQSLVDNLTPKVALAIPIYGDGG